MTTEAVYQPIHKIRIVTSGSLFDGHDAAINIMRRIKRSFDPHGVLNPGKIFTDEATEEQRG